MMIRLCYYAVPYVKSIICFDICQLSVLRTFNILSIFNEINQWSSRSVSLFSFLCEFFYFI